MSTCMGFEPTTLMLDFFHNPCKTNVSILFNSLWFRLFGSVNAFHGKYHIQKTVNNLTPHLLPPSKLPLPALSMAFLQRIQLFLCQIEFCMA